MFKTEEYYCSLWYAFDYLFIVAIRYCCVLKIYLTCTMAASINAGDKRA